MLAVQEYKTLFELVPDLHVVLSPDLRITSDVCLKATMTNRKRVVGHYLAELFTHHVHNTQNKQAINLEASLKYLLDHEVPHAVSASFTLQKKPRK